jgi:hypothetical protein
MRIKIGVGIGLTAYATTKGYAKICPLSHLNRKPQQMELFAASQTAESLGKNDRLMEMILERNNIIRAWKRVCANKGVPGVDGMRTNQLGKYLERHWLKIEKDLLNGPHKPLPVKRKEISKPDGGVRLLGIPTVLDRFIQ